MQDYGDIVAVLHQYHGIMVSWYHGIVHGPPPRISGKVNQWSVELCHLPQWQLSQWRVTMSLFVATSSCKTRKDSWKGWCLDWFTKKIDEEIYNSGQQRNQGGFFSDSALPDLLHHCRPALHQQKEPLRCGNLFGSSMRFPIDSIDWHGWICSSWNQTKSGLLMATSLASARISGSLSLERNETTWIGSPDLRGSRFVAPQPPTPVPPPYAERWACIRPAVSTRTTSWPQQWLMTSARERSMEIKDATFGFRVSNCILRNVSWILKWE